MSISPARLVGAVLALIVGALTTVTAFGLYVADAVIDRGIGHVAAADAAELDRVVAVLPLVVAFGVILSIGAIGLLAGARWARPVVAMVVATGLVSSLVALVALALGNDPFVTAVHGQTADGIGMFLVATAILSALLALVIVDAGPRRSTAGSTGPSAA